MSTLTPWHRPVRKRHSSPAASAAAAMVACAAVPIANDEGSTGSATLNSTAPRAATGWSAARQSAARTFFGFGAVIQVGRRGGVSTVRDSRSGRTGAADPHEGEAPYRTIDRRSIGTNEEGRPEVGDSAPLAEGGAHVRAATELVERLSATDSAEPLALESLSPRRHRRVPANRHPSTLAPPARQGV